VVSKLSAERAQLEMQLVVARVTATTVVVSELTTWMTLEATKQSAEDRATAAQSAAATATTKWDAMAMRLALAEVEIEKLRAAATSANEAAERATTAAAAAEASARDATQAMAQEKAALKAKVMDLELDLATTGVDLVTESRQFSEVAN
jgi:hypothetical protein